jgi:hypothetical protein
LALACTSHSIVNININTVQAIIAAEFPVSNWLFQIRHFSRFQLQRLSRQEQVGNGG